jgi:hypothetical protein
VFWDNLLVSFSRVKNPGFVNWLFNNLRVYMLLINVLLINKGCVVKVQIFIVILSVEYMCFVRTIMDLPTNLTVMDSVFK